MTPALHQAGVPEYGRLITYVGGFWPYKNITNLIQSFSILVNYYPFENIYLVMVGEIRQETLFSEIENPQALVQKLDLIQMEGFGLPAVEAAACGFPVIATKESPLPELLGQAENFYRSLPTL